LKKIGFLTSKTLLKSNEVQEIRFFSKIGFLKSKTLLKSNEVQEIRFFFKNRISNLKNEYVSSFTIHHSPFTIMLRDKDNSPVLLDFGAARYDVGSHSRSITAIVTPK